MASHQLRTPLTSIKGYISMLEDGDAGSLNSSQREYLEYAYSGSVRMVNLINDLLNVSRMQAGKFLIDKEFADIEFIVREEVQNLQAHANTKNIHLKYIAPKKKIPDISLDINKTRQVIMNFIDNAIYYTPKGSINVSLEIIEDDIELRVKDTGIGVPKAAKKQLFSKFFRAPNAMTLRPDGTGLGLYLAKRVIEDQNGTIIFESEEGKGSTFGFRLPMNSKQGGSHAANK
jgi:signal transduction histidine kinase